MMKKFLGLAAIKTVFRIRPLSLVLLFLIIGVSLGFSSVAQADIICLSGEPGCNGGGSVTTSTSSSTFFTDVYLPEVRIDTFFTSLRGSINGGPVLVEFDFNLAFTDPTVQAAITQVQAALNLIANPQTLTFMDPVLALSIENLLNSQTNFLGKQFNHSTLAATMEDTIGPGTIIIGDRDNGGTAFQVLAGTVNMNVNTHTENFYDQIYQNQNTYLTSQDYDIVGTSPSTAPVPEPGTMVLLGLGMAGLAIYGKRRQKNA